MGPSSITQIIDVIVSIIVVIDVVVVGGNATFTIDCASQESWGNNCTGSMNGSHGVSSSSLRESVCRCTN